VKGESWRAVADEPARAGEELTIAAVSGLTLRVKKQDKEA
jgi:membrane protein implicated in regulation of membrane protease activity